MWFALGGCANLKLVSMYDSISTQRIQNKADALQYAINLTMQYRCGENSKVDYEEAKKLYDFFCANAEFPDDPVKKTLAELMLMLQAMCEPRQAVPALSWKSGTPEEFVLAAAVISQDGDDVFKLLLATYDMQNQEWLELYTMHPIENVTHYCVIPELPFK